MQLRDHEGVKGKRDAYPFDPRLLKIEPGYNVRQMDTPEMRAKNLELKESIRANGVKVPLEVRLDGEDVYVIAGHRRHAMVMELIAEGEPIETVLTIAEPKNTNDAERTLNLAISNSGEPLKPLEVAEIVRRLTAFGWDKGQIAKRMGWKSTGTVTQHLDMLAMPAELQQAVKQNKVSATMARRLEAQQPGLAAKIIADAADEQKRLGKKPRATPKAIKKATGKSDRLPVPERKPRGVVTEEAPPKQQQRETVSEPAWEHPISFGASAEALVPPPAQEELRSPHASPLNGSKDFIEALRPVLEYAARNDLKARADDDVVTIEFFVRDVRAAAKAHAQATAGAA